MRLALAVLIVSMLVGTNARADDRNLLGAEACVSQRNLSKIIDRFEWAERTNWQRGFVIAELHNPRLRYDVFDGPSMIEHTHCIAEALMTDGRRWTVYYVVEKGMGFASIGTGVEFCVLGLDPWHVYERNCRTIR